MKDKSDANRNPRGDAEGYACGAKQPEPAASDGIDRRNFLSCMAWAGTGLLWTMAGGVPTSKLFAATPGPRVEMQRMHMPRSGFSFVQISDSHIGFNKAANQDVSGTLKLAIGKINDLSGKAGSAAAHRRCHAVVEGSRVRYGTGDHQGREGRRRRSMFRASMIRRSTMAHCIVSDSAKALSAMAGTASITRACTLSG